MGATVEDAGFEAHPTPAGVASLLAAAQQLLPGLAACRLEGTWAGLRPATDDGLPLVGPVDATGRVLAATGHYRNGILLAPRTARAIRSAVTGDGADLASAFLPGRSRSLASSAVSDREPQ